MKDKVIWCDKGLFLLNYGFCPSELAFRKFCKQYKLDDTNFVYNPPVIGARCSYVEHDNGSVDCVVYLGKDVPLKNDLYVASLLVHEAVHVWQEQIKKMGEDEPSSEFEAYGIQYIFYNLFDAYFKTKIKD